MESRRRKRCFVELIPAKSGDLLFIIILLFYEQFFEGFLMLVEHAQQRKWLESLDLDADKIGGLLVKPAEAFKFQKVFAVVRKLGRDKEFRIGPELLSQIVTDNLGRMLLFRKNLLLHGIVARFEDRDRRLDQKRSGRYTFPYLYGIIELSYVRGYRGRYAQSMAVEIKILDPFVDTGD